MHKTKQEPKKINWNFFTETNCLESLRNFEAKLFRQILKVVFALRSRQDCNLDQEGGNAEGADRIAGISIQLLRRCKKLLTKWISKYSGRGLMLSLWARPYPIPLNIDYKNQIYSLYKVCYWGLFNVCGSVWSHYLNYPINCDPIKGCPLWYRKRMFWSSRHWQQYWNIWK